MGIGNGISDLLAGATLSFAADDGDATGVTRDALGESTITAR